ncbi:hypothetical protein [Nostoc sp.]|uniref:hypothetical protein n=1 Tax=Nostoc sp. TaxID=1180 RepID=UPI002FF5B25F
MFIFSHSHHSIKSDRFTNTKTAIALQVQEKRKQRSPYPFSLDLRFLIELRLN